MNNINNILDNLSDEEKELHKNLISECIERENFLIENDKDIKTGTRELDKAISSFSVSSKEMFEITKELKKSFDKNSESVLKSMLSMLPEDKFFRD